MCYVQTSMLALLQECYVRRMTQFGHHLVWWAILMNQQRLALQSQKIVLVTICQVYQDGCLAHSCSGNDCAHRLCTIIFKFQGPVREIDLQVTD